MQGGAGQGEAGQGGAGQVEPVDRFGVAPRRTGWIVCGILAVSVLATIWSTLIIVRTAESNRRTTASLFPLLQESQSFEREILNARIAFIYHVTIQKPGSLQAGWERYRRAEEGLGRIQRPVEDSSAAVLLRPRQEAVNIAWRTYDRRLRAVLGMVAGGTRSGVEYNRQVAEWAAEGGALVDAAHDLSGVTVALSRAQSNSTAFLLHLAMVIVNANGALWLVLGGSYFWLRRKPADRSRRARRFVMERAEAASRARGARLSFAQRRKAFLLSFSGRACAGVLLMLRSVSVVLGTGWFALRGIEHLTSSQSESMHSQQILVDAESLRAFVAEAESDTRGYVFSGKTTLLVSQQSAMRAAWDRLNKLRNEANGDTAQSERLGVVHDNLEERFGSLTLLGNVRQTEGPEAVTRLTASGHTLELKHRLEAAIDAFESAQYDVLVAAVLEANHAAAVSKALILFAAFPAALGLGVLGVITLHLLTCGTRLQDRLKRLNDTLEAVLRTAPVAIASFGAGAEPGFWNPAAKELFEVGRGAGAGSLGAGTAPELGELVQRIEEGFDKDVSGGSVTSLSVEWPVTSGECRILQVSAARVADDHGGPHDIVAVAQDMTEQLRMQEQLAFQASHDALTGLPNRFSLDARLKRMVERAAETGTVCAVFGIDVDRLKDVNDRLGHEAGDLFLKKITERLASVLRKTDTLIRVGGDEFLCLAETMRCPADAEVVATKLIASLARPMDIGGTTLTGSISVGIAVCPGDATDTEELRKKADAALYRAKASGRNQFRRFEQSEAERRVELIGDCLETALEKGCFRLVYQPQYTVGGKLRGFEALLRFQHPALGAVSPAEFIPIAEQNRLIQKIGSWVLQEACTTYTRWLRHGFSPGILAVNVSAVQFSRGDFSDQVVSTLRQADLQPGCVELELTESMVMSDPEEADRQMRRLERCGVRLAIDDFGTGYSSLSHLNRLPIGTLKIDRTFVHQLAGGNNSLSIVEAIVAMGKALSMEIIAEGVETEEQRSCLAALGCDHLQGFLFAKPLEAEAAEVLLGNLCSQEKVDVSARGSRSRTEHSLVM